MKPNDQSADKRVKRIVLWGSIVLFVATLLFLTHDIIITNILAYRICKADPNPKTFIKQTVEYPESIYWEDNIYPGFDEQDRLLMIRNYLDGIHLKTMALNGPDGAIYLYTATEEDWQVRRGEPDYFDKLAAEAKAIASRGTTYTRQTMPQLNYSVIFNPVFLTPFQRRYLWSDEVTITDNKTREVIAYNRRLMRRWYMIEPEPLGGCISMTELYTEAKCGEALQYAMDDQVLFKNITTDNLLKNSKCRRSFKSKLLNFRRLEKSLTY